ncbi:hypothetical protein SKAU_G00331790 [Synaphobranchus kaupii]|uniref:TLC domain-containing protein n=1 Tax=Synaphobranchus kaupii TaxID=118154 RepID=A0A9Q1IGD5_SYNKA|nr:hypothetical protein SKAU_G00331790 [Synaphobranchus kaupii]
MGRLPQSELSLGITGLLIKGFQQVAPTLQSKKKGGIKRRTTDLPLAAQVRGLSPSLRSNLAWAQGERVRWGPGPISSVRIPPCSSDSSGRSRPCNPTTPPALETHLINAVGRAGDGRRIFLRSPKITGIIAMMRPVARWCQLKPRCAAKMPESSWKLCFYSVAWSYSAYLLFCTHYSFFHNPPSVFYGWRRGMAVPTDIAMAYLIQGSFYGHSIYASIYMDAWRRDSIIMVMHHIVTLALITFSYAFRYHNVGVLVLFLHDVNDVQLEFTKLNVYFQTRGGGYHVANSIISTAGCVSFSITWFWFRLYWFPLKVLYATCVSSLVSVPDIPFYFFFNGLLLLLLVMNIYWFLYIMFFVVKVLTGQMREVNDVREYEEEDEEDEEEEEERLLTERDGAVKNGRSPVQNGLVKDKHL